MSLPSGNAFFSDLLLIIYHLIIFAVIIAAGWLIGRLVSWLVAKLVSAAGGDSIMRQTEVGRTLAKSGYSSSTLARSITKWVIYITAFLLAVESLQLPLITSSVNSFLDYLPKLVGGALIFIIGIIFSDWAGELVKKSFQPEQRQLFYIDFFGNIFRFILYFVTITIALSYMGIDVTILYIIVQAFAWSVAIFVGVTAGIVVGWVLKDKIKDLFAR